MRVAWDLQAVTGERPTGLGISARMLLDAIQQHAPEVEVIGLRPDEENRGLSSVPQRVRWEQWRLPHLIADELRRAPLDLLYCPALGAPLRCRVPVVAHVHDLISLRFPEQFGGVAGWYWKSLLPRCWKSCRALTVSNPSVTNEIVELLRYPRERIHVVPYYPDPALKQIAVRPRSGTAGNSGSSPARRPCFITLASHEPRKNLEMPIAALHLLRERGVDADLKLVGRQSPYTSVLKEVAGQSALDSGIIEFVDYASREDVVSMLLDSTALLFTSSYEGYGMPPQEAQSLGVPVVLSDIPCHRQVYDDPRRLSQLPEAMRLAPPFVGLQNVEALAAEMQRLLEDSTYRERLARSGEAYSATFSAEATAAALREAYLAARA